MSICGPGNTNLRKRYRRCPMCECITETVEQDGGYWGFRQWCCRCGDAWADGELYARGFYRYWRRDAQRHARRLWDQAIHGPHPTFEELFPHLAEETTSA